MSARIPAAELLVEFADAAEQIRVARAADDRRVGIVTVSQVEAARLIVAGLDLPADYAVASGRGAAFQSSLAGGFVTVAISGPDIPAAAIGAQIPELTVRGRRVLSWTESELGYG